MKRIFLLAAFAPFIITSCSNDKTATTEDVVPKGMQAKDLKEQGLPLKINVPDSTNGPAEITETPTGIEVKIGSHFDLMVNTASAEESDIAKLKPVIEAGDELPKTFTVNDATDLQWEINLGDRTICHFFHIVKIDNTTYYVRDNNNNPDNEFKKEDITRMLESAKSLRARPAVAPKS